MIKNKLFVKCIVVTLLVALLTFNVGKVTRVSAVGTSVATIAGLAFVATGAVYLSYLALTNADIMIPHVDDLNDWLSSVGKKVSQYPSGHAAYQEIYELYARSPASNFIDGVWTWTEAKLRSFINDFSDTRINQDICTYRGRAVTDIPLNGYDYSNVEIRTYPQKIYMTNFVYNSWAAFEADGYTMRIGEFGQRCIGYLNYIQYIQSNEQLRNCKKLNGYYTVQAFRNGSWVDIGTSLPQIIGNAYYDTTFVSTIEGISIDGLTMYGNRIQTLSVIDYAPPLLDAVIYDQATDSVSELVRVEGEVVETPNWNDPDNDNRPIVPWVPIPQLPANITPPSGYINPQWGFNINDLLDLLESLSEALMTIGAIQDLINAFAGLHGDEYYLYFNDGNTNYYTYYQPMIYDNDTENVTYNINVSDVDEHLPVDLNTIAIYSNNRYVDAFKQSAQVGSSIVRDLVVFWYDVDPEIIYVVFGCCILTLIAAFIGKWGHS